MSNDPLASDWFIINETIAFDRATTPRIQLLGGYVLSPIDDATIGAYSIDGDQITILMDKVGPYAARYDLRALSEEGEVLTEATPMLSGYQVAILDGEEFADPVALFRDGPWLVEWEGEHAAELAAG